MTRLEKERVQRGLTQSQLALDAGVTTQTVMRIEKGYTRGSKLSLGALAIALEIPIEESRDLAAEFMS